MFKNNITSLTIVITTFFAVFHLFIVNNIIPDIKKSYAQTNSYKSTLLVRNTAKAYFTNGSSDKKNVTVEGSICFAGNLSTGCFKATVWATRVDNGKRLTRPGLPDSDLNSGLQFCAGFGYPKCYNIDNQTGLADLAPSLAKSSKFKLNLYFPQPLSPDNCPDLYLNISSTRVSASKFTIIKLSETGICGSNVAPTQYVPQITQAGTNATPVPTRTPTRVPSPIPTTRITTVPSPTNIFPEKPTVRPTAISTQEPSATPTPASIIKGNIFIYSCQNPDLVKIDYCTSNLTGSACSEISSNITTAGSLGNTVFLQDNNLSDNYWKYQYEIYNNALGQALTEGEEIIFTVSPSGGPITALINNNIYYSKEEESGNLTVKASMTRDYFIWASLTCDCTFTAKTYIRDVNQTRNQRIYDMDNNNVYGTANNRTIVFKGDKPGASFVNGELNVGPLIRDPYGGSGPQSYGADGLASIKLYYDKNKFSIVGHECRSFNSVGSCPNESANWYQDVTSLLNPEIINGIRVACGTNVEYGWVLKRK